MTNTVDRFLICEAENVTLDGHPARITGYSFPFAQVRRRDGVGGSVEFAWEAAAMIIDHGGKFRS